MVTVIPRVNADQIHSSIANTRLEFANVEGVYPTANSPIFRVDGGLSDQSSIVLATLVDDFRRSFNLMLTEGSSFNIIEQLTELALDQRGPVSALITTQWRMSTVVDELVRHGPAIMPTRRPNRGPVTISSIPISGGGVRFEMNDTARTLTESNNLFRRYVTLYGAVVLVESVMARRSNPYEYRPLSVGSCIPWGMVVSIGPIIITILRSSLPLRFSLPVFRARLCSLMDIIDALKRHHCPRFFSSGIWTPSYQDGQNLINKTAARLIRTMPEVRMLIEGISE